MIYPYTIYEKEIRERFQKELYNSDLKFFFDKGYRSLPNLSKPTGRYYAIAEDAFLGYMFYYYDGSMITDFHIVWFNRADLYEWNQRQQISSSNRIVRNMEYVLRQAFTDFGITDMFFSTITEGPLYLVYSRIIDHFKGGDIAGVLHNRVRLEDGKLYDKVYFEIHLPGESIKDIQRLV